MHLIKIIAKICILSDNKKYKLDLFLIASELKMSPLISKVLVLYVGGTIGMKKNDDSVYVPAPDGLKEYLKKNPQVYNEELAEQYAESPDQLVFSPQEGSIVVYQIKEYSPLLDSSNMSLKDWIKIAKDIELNYQHFVGFVILHGTDTLVYTASALSFMMEGLRKPIILTGSQVPVFKTKSDGWRNIVFSLTLAGCYKVPEVCIFFASKLLRGNRTMKKSISDLEAFHSFNYPDLAKIESDITLNDSYIFKPETRVITFNINTKFNENVLLFPVTPTLTAVQLERILQSVQGLVLQCYGSGNFPSNQKELLQVLQNAVKREILIFNISLVPHGSVNSAYETGKVLEDIGVIPGYDMTPEAALTKLGFVLGLELLSFYEKAELMKKDIRGELTNNSNDNDKNN